MERVLVGKPVGHSGGETAMSQLVAEFAEKLRRHLPCPVELRDERLTSVEANRTLREAGLSIQKRRRAVDRVAAVLILNEDQANWESAAREHVRGVVLVRPATMKQVRRALDQLVRSDGDNADADAGEPDEE